MAKRPPTSDFVNLLIDGLTSGRPEPAPVKPRRPMSMVVSPYVDEPQSESAEPPSLTKSILNVLNRGSQTSIERLAFETDQTDIDDVQ